MQSPQGACITERVCKYPLISNIPQDFDDFCLHIVHTCGRSGQAPHYILCNECKNARCSLPRGVRHLTTRRFENDRVGCTVTFGQLQWILFWPPLQAGQQVDKVVSESHSTLTTVMFSKLFSWLTDVQNVFLSKRSRLVLVDRIRESLSPKLSWWHRAVLVWEPHLLIMIVSMANSK